MRGGPTSKGLPGGLQERARVRVRRCGAGGGVKKGFPTLALEIAKKRIKEAEETGAEYLVTICPFCNRNLSDAAKDLGSSLKIKDLVELVDEAID